MGCAAVQGGTCRKSCCCLASLQGSAPKAPGEDARELSLLVCTKLDRAFLARAQRDVRWEEPVPLAGEMQGRAAALGGRWELCSELLLLFKLALRLLPDPSCDLLLPLFFLSATSLQFLGCPSSRRGLWQAGRLLSCQQTSIGKPSSLPLDSAEADSEQSSPNTNGLCIDLG